MASKLKKLNKDCSQHTCERPVCVQMDTHTLLCDYMLCTGHWACWFSACDS